MSRPVNLIPLVLLFEILERYPHGASLEEILLGLTPPVARRTLQRKLAALVKEEILAVSGQTRSRRYKLIKTPKEPQREEPQIYPMSPEAATILAQISRPLEQRKPVAFYREFLDSYRPNVSFYLPETSRQKLWSMGRSNGELPAGTYAKKILHKLLLDLSWNSSRLEGNTYSLLETEQLLEKGIVAEGKELKETQMILNHKEAIEFLINSAEDIDINRYTILNLHTFLYDNLLADPAASGRLRVIPVGISQSVYQPCAIPQLLEECFSLLLQKGAAIQDPFEQAFFLMVQLPYLQPFDDVNKRTSRLAANIPLIRNNLCPFSFIDVPENLYIHGLLGIYELNRVELLRDLFLWTYERSCDFYAATRKVLGEPDPFRLKYRVALQELVHKVVLNRQNKHSAIQEIRRQSQQIPWQDREQFVEVAEKALLALHEGNIARYKIRLQEFEIWKLVWESGSDSTSH